MAAPNQKLNTAALIQHLTNSFLTEEPLQWIVCTRKHDRRYKAALGHQLSAPLLPGQQGAGQLHFSCLWYPNEHVIDSSSITCYLGHIRTTKHHMSLQLVIRDKLKHSFYFRTDSNQSSWRSFFRRNCLYIWRWKTWWTREIYSGRVIYSSKAVLAQHNRSFIHGGAISEQFGSFFPTQLSKTPVPVSPYISFKVHMPVAHRVILVQDKHVAVNSNCTHYLLIITLLLCVVLLNRHISAVSFLTRRLVLEVCHHVQLSWQIFWIRIMSYSTEESMINKLLTNTKAQLCSQSF